LSAATRFVPLFIALLTTAAQADTTYTCEGGSTMVFRDNTREMVIHRPGEMSISLPYGGSASRFAWWSPYTGDEGYECGKAPCAEDWAPADQPRQTWYKLDEGKKVFCLEKT